MMQELFSKKNGDLEILSRDCHINRYNARCDKKRGIARIRKAFNSNNKR